MRPRPVAEIRDPVHGYIKLTGVERELVDSPYIQRLRRIHQLAGSYLVYPGAVHTRFEHVVGTMHVAGMVAESLISTSGMDYDHLQELRIAALLHDVGHGPFSHMFEEVLAVKSDATHEDISQRVVAETSICDILEKNGYSARKMSSLAVGLGSKRLPFLNEVIAGGLSADMMDYLPRDSHFTGVEYGRVDIQRVVDSFYIVDGHLAIDDAAVDAFEALLLARYQMFKAVYFHRTVRAAELMLIHSMMLADDYLSLTDISNLDRYLELTDEVVLHNLTTLPGETSALREAKRLALGFRDRALVKCVYERVLQRKDSAGDKLFANEEARKEMTAQIASDAGVDPMKVYIDVPTTPSVPNTYSRQAFTSVSILQGEGKERNVEVVPLDRLPLAGSIGGFMDVLRVYTTPESRRAVEKAAHRALAHDGLRPSA
jgi:uncharacterized protein